MMEAAATNLPSNLSDAGPAQADVSQGSAQLPTLATCHAGATHVAGNGNTHEPFDLEFPEMGSGAFPPQIDADSNFASLTSVPPNLLSDMPLSVLAHPPGTISNASAVTTPPTLLEQGLVGQPSELNNANPSAEFTVLPNFSDSCYGYPNQLRLGRGEILSTMPLLTCEIGPPDMTPADWCSFYPTPDSGASPASWNMTDSDTCNNFRLPSSAKPLSQQADQMSYLVQCFMIMIKVEHERIDLERRKLKVL